MSHAFTSYGRLRVDDDPWIYGHITISTHLPVMNPDRYRDWVWRGPAASGHHEVSFRDREWAYPILYSTRGDVTGNVLFLATADSGDGLLEVTIRTDRRDRAAEHARFMADVEEHAVLSRGHTAGSQSGGREAAVWPAAAVSVGAVASGWPGSQSGPPDPRPPAAVSVGGVASTGATGVLTTDDLDRVLTAIGMPANAVRVASQFPGFGYESTVRAELSAAFATMPLADPGPAPPPPPPPPTPPPPPAPRSGYRVRIHPRYRLDTD